MHTILIFNAILICLIPTAADQLHDDDTYVEDDTDSPLIVPPPGSILRRSARTKIRKNSLLGDGNGHRFGPSRRSSKGLDAAMEDDPNRPVQGKRQASISSVNSLEDERKTPSGERPTSAELRRRSPRSPEKAQPAPEPLPPQYMPSTGITLAQQMDAADLGPQEPDRLTLSPGRVGADIPAASQAVPQQLQWTSTAQLGEGVTSPRSIGPVTGSLRTTKRIGTQLQPSPEVQPRTSSAAATASRPVAGPGPLQLPVSPDAPTLQLFEEPEAARASPPSGADARPALPMKRPSEAQQGDRQTLAPAQEPKPAQREPSHIPRPTKPTSAPFQESPKTAPASSLPSQPARKTPASPVQASAPSKEKEKKSTWAKLGLSRSSKDEPEIDDGASIASNSSGGSSTFGRKGKKTKKDKLQTEISPEKKQQPSATLIEKNEKPDSSSSFFGGLFGKKKAEQGDQPKKDGSTTPIPMQMPTPPPTASGMLTPDGKYINFYRLPIHIERAVYRLSHIKLANPRRPLYEQVLISNLMFWYLG